MDFKLNSANELMNSLVKQCAPLDEICLYFNIDLAHFLKIASVFEVFIIHKPAN